MFQRYGLYVVPEGDLFAAGSAWLGWDSARGAAVEQPDIAGLPEPAATLTAKPRKYGFHGTIKPPFALADGSDFAGLAAATKAFCARQAPVSIGALEVRRLGSFIALTPSAPCKALTDLASAAVIALDPYRAPPTEAELARRRKAGLSDAQETLLQRWGYPYVMEAFRFHMTLTGATNQPDTARKVLACHFAPVLPKPFAINNLAVMGEDAAGGFHLIHRYTLSG